MRADCRRIGAVTIGLAVLWLAAAVAVWWLPATAPWLLLVVAALALVALAVVLRMVVYPLVDLARRASQLAAGVWEGLSTPCSGIAEVEELRRALNAMSEHVRRAQTTGQAYAAALGEGQEAERAHLAHELHDATVQSLIAIGQRLERAGRLIDTDAARARATIAEARQDIVATVAGLREIIAGLRPPALDELGLVPALELMVRRLPAQPAVQLVVEGPVRRLAPDRGLAVLRLGQEGLSNVPRHAAATNATVRLAFEPDALLVAVEDDGQGIADGQTTRDLAAQGHWGLIGLEERAARFGGSVALTSTPGKGTRLAVRIPNHDTLQPAEAVVDPGCQATIPPATAYGSVVHNGETYFFCCPVCQGAFQRDPGKYLSAAA